MMSQRQISKTDIVTYTGRFVDPINPNPEDIDIRDIGHSLSNQCRFTGHTREFYSVAQHSVLVSLECNPEDAMWGLLHDASEAYLADLARPLKYNNELGAVYREAEQNLMEVIANKFSLAWDICPVTRKDVLPASVKNADDVLIRTEARDLMPPEFPATSSLQEPGDFLPDPIEPWTPGRAYGEFMFRYMELVAKGP